MPRELWARKTDGANLKLKQNIQHFTQIIILTVKILPVACAAAITVIICKWEMIPSSSVALVGAFSWVASNLHRNRSPFVWFSGVALSRSHNFVSVAGEKHQCGVARSGKTSRELRRMPRTRDINKQEYYLGRLHKYHLVHSPRHRRRVFVSLKIRLGQ